MAWVLKHAEAPASTRSSEVGQSSSTYAALGGHLEVLQWAHANGCPWKEETCQTAAQGGHLEMLQWAHANGCPWDERTCAEATSNGHFELLSWAQANGAPQ